MSPGAPETAGEATEADRPAITSASIAAPVVAAAPEPAIAFGEAAVDQESVAARPQPVADQRTTSAPAEPEPAEPVVAPAPPAAAEATPPPATQPASSLIERASEARTDTIPAQTPRPTEEASIPKRFELPPDMVMIETSASTRARADETAESTDESNPPRRPRKPSTTDTADEPLVQIETRK